MHVIGLTVIARHTTEGQLTVLEGSDLLAAVEGRYSYRKPVL